jgi:hypothetical protein
MKTHDYTEPYWGHDYVFEPVSKGMKGNMMGWGRGISNGDFLILENGGATTRYKVTEISYFPDPPDMWSAKVKFAPRKQKVEV